MYSRNDYRDYLEYRLSESTDFLAHYGIKGMKWRRRKAAMKTINADQERGMKRSQQFRVTDRGDKYFVTSRHNSVTLRGFDSDRSRRTKRVGTNTNSLKTRRKDAKRRKKLGLKRRSKKQKYTTVSLSGRIR